MSESPPKALLALDPGKRSYGYAVFKKGKFFKVSTTSFRDCTDMATLLAEYGKWLRNTLKHYRITHVAVERSVPRQAVWAEQYWGMYAVLRMLCASNDLPLDEIHWNTAKAHLVKGGASKDDMLLAIQKRLPDAGVTSKDEADAIAIGMSSLEI